MPWRSERGFEDGVAVCPCAALTEGLVVYCLYLCKLSEYILYYNLL